MYTIKWTQEYTGYQQTMLAMQDEALNRLVDLSNLKEANEVIAKIKQSL